VVRRRLPPEERAWADSERYALLQKRVRRLIGQLSRADAEMRRIEARMRR
jgi:hypothetical protein